MTERELREKVVSTARNYIGTQMGDDIHHKMVDIYNSHKPLARGYPLKYTDDWCSAFISVVSIECGATSIIPTEVSCGRHVELFKSLHEWVEDDSYRPKPGDVILYNWDGDGRGDDTGWPDHIGYVENVAAGQITVIEGNMGHPSRVDRRPVPLDGKYIRGFGIPDYAALAAKTPSKKPSSGGSSSKIREGDKVRVKSGAVWYDGSQIPGFVFDKMWPVAEISGSRAVLGGGLNSPIRVKYLYKPSSKPKPPREVKLVNLQLPDVRYGDKTDAARRAMMLLRDRGYLPKDYNCAPGAVFGKAAVAAVKAFQKKNGLTVDGWIGAKTWFQLIAD